MSSKKRSKNSSYHESSNDRNRQKFYDYYIPKSELKDEYSKSDLEEKSIKKITKEIRLDEIIKAEFAKELADIAKKRESNDFPLQINLYINIHQRQNPEQISIGHVEDSAIAVKDSNAVDNPVNSTVSQEHSNAAGDTNNSAVAQGESSASDNPVNSAVSQNESTSSDNPDDSSVGQDNSSASDDPSNSAVAQEKSNASDNPTNSDVDQKL